MKEIKKTVETVVAYEAFDGTTFTDKEECSKYENSAFGVVLARIKKLVVIELVECDLFENYGYGSEEYYYWVMDIKDKADVNLFNQFRSMIGSGIGSGTELTDDYIGKRILVGTGSCYDSWNYRTLYVRGTYDDMVEKFKKDMDKFFNPKENEDEEKTE